MHQQRHSSFILSLVSFLQLCLHAALLLHRIRSLRTFTQVRINTLFFCCHCLFMAFAVHVLCFSCALNKHNLVTLQYVIYNTACVNIT